MTVAEPHRGEVWTVNFSPGRGSEQRGVRPALVIQNDVGNQYAATTIVATITSQIKIYPVTVPLRKGDADLTKPSMVNLTQILTVDRGRLRKRIGRLSADQMDRVNAALRISLELE